ncbi:MAG TPA: ThuA domain-containing protein [Dyadobacter sp.]|jgi:type 1 glutamine amidotransferase|nr:ThuA domain-containing protein [Dyadobacter sp.]
MIANQRLILAALVLVIGISAFVWRAVSPPIPMKDSGPKQVVFIAGGDSHRKGEHEHKGGTKLLAEKFKAAYPDSETLVIQGWPDDLTSLKEASTIVVFSDGGNDHFLIPHLTKLDQILAKGTGLVMLHFALEIPKGEGGQYLQKWIGGYFETDWSVNPVFTASFDSIPKHPVTNGVKPFAIKDEWYYHMRFVNRMNGVTPILQTLPPESTLQLKDGSHSNNKFVRKAVLEKKEPQVMAWAYDRPAIGRGFGFTGAHIHANWQNDNFRKLVLNAIAWTAQMKVPDEGINSTRPTPEELEKSSKKI